jgi:hypothetical protein
VKCSVFAALQLLHLDYLMSTTLPPLDAILRVETYRLAIAARDGEDVRILILERLEQRVGGSPQAVKWSVVMGRDVNVGLVRAHVLCARCGYLVLQ